MRRLGLKAWDLRAKSGERKFRLKEALEPQRSAGGALAGDRLPSPPLPSGTTHQIEPSLVNSKIRLPSE